MRYVCVSFTERTRSGRVARREDLALPGEPRKAWTLIITYWIYFCVHSAPSLSATNMAVHATPPTPPIIKPIRKPISVPMSHLAKPLNHSPKAIIQDANTIASGNVMSHLSILAPQLGQKL